MDLKVVLIAVVALALATIAGAYWLRHNVDRLVKNAIETQGSKIAGVQMSVGGVKISALDGQGELSNLVIGNPPGFKSPYALKVERVLVAIDLASLPKDVVVVRKIEVVAPNVIYESGDTATNFDVIQKNIANNLGTGKESQGGKRLIVEHFNLRNAKAEASAAFMNGKTVGMPLPDVVLKDIGRKQNGVTPDQFGQIVAGAITKKLTGAYHFDRALNATRDALGKAGSAISDIFK